MTTWTSDELDKIGRAEELEIASLRRDGTLRKPVTIWVVRHGDDLYIRSAYGRTAAWFRGTQVRHEGHVKAGGVDKDAACGRRPCPQRPDRRRVPRQVSPLWRTVCRPCGGPWGTIRDNQTSAALSKLFQQALKVRAGLSRLPLNLWNTGECRYPRQSAFRPDLPCWPTKLLTLIQCTDPQGIGLGVLNCAGINRRTTHLAERMNALGSAICGLDVLAWLSFEDAEAVGRRKNVRSECRTGEHLAV
jgi:hypothetical protein